MCAPDCFSRIPCARKVERNRLRVFCSVYSTWRSASGITQRGCPVVVPTLGIAYSGTHLCATYHTHRGVVRSPNRNLLDFSGRLATRPRAVASCLFGPRREIRNMYVKSRVAYLMESITRRLLTFGWVGEFVRFFSGLCRGRAIKNVAQPPP